jgi:hypothetical protein
VPGHWEGDPLQNSQNAVDQFPGNRPHKPHRRAIYPPGRYRSRP